MKKLITLFTLVLLTDYVFAQKSTRWELIKTENIYIASTVKAHEGTGAKDRVLLDANLPSGTIGYAIRITVNCKNNNAGNLFSIIENIPNPDIKAASIVSNLVLNGDGNQYNVYLFNDRVNAQKFVMKQGFDYCSSYTQISNISNYETKCLDTICIGLQNNNMVKALQVKVELVALLEVN